MEIHVTPDLRRARGARGWALLVDRVLIGGVFLFAAVGKVRHPFAFADSIGGFKLLHESVLLEVGLMMIWLEIIAGALVVLGLWARAAAWVLCGLLAVFLMALGSAVARGLDIDCGCFGALMASGVGWLSLGRTVVFMAMAGAVARYGPGRFGLDGALERRGFFESEA